MAPRWWWRQQLDGLMFECSSAHARTFLLSASSPHSCSSSCPSLYSCVRGLADQKAPLGYGVRTSRHVFSCYINAVYVLYSCLDWGSCLLSPPAAVNCILCSGARCWRCWRCHQSQQRTAQTVENTEAHKAYGLALPWVGRGTFHYCARERGRRHLCSPP